MNTASIPCVGPCLSDKWLFLSLSPFLNSQLSFLLPKWRKPVEQTVVPFLNPVLKHVASMQTSSSVVPPQGGRTGPRPLAPPPRNPHRVNVWRKHPCAHAQQHSKTSLANDGEGVHSGSTYNTHLLRAEHSAIAQSGATTYVTLPRSHATNEHADKDAWIGQL